MSDNLKAWAHWVLAEHPPADADRRQMALDIVALVKRNATLEAVLAAARVAVTRPWDIAVHSRALQALREAIRAADQASAVGEKDGGGDEQGE